MATVVLQHMIVLSRLAVLIQKKPVEGEIDLQHREVMEILFNAICGQYLLDKSVPGDDFGAFCYSLLIAIRGINLTDPAGISIRGRAYENLRMKIAEIKGLQIGFGVGKQQFSVMKSGGRSNG